MGKIIFFKFCKIAQHPSLREKLSESVDGPTAATHGDAQWNEDGKDEAGPGQSEAPALASHLPVVEEHPPWAGAFADNAGKVSAKPGAAGAEVQLVVLAVQAWIDPGAVRRRSAQEPVDLAPPVPVVEPVAVLAAPAPAAVAGRQLAQLVAGIDANSNHGRLLQFAPDS